MKIGIFGGTFNPPHIGHVHAAARAMDDFCFDKLIIIPSGLPPHKTLPEGSPNSEQRLEMVSIAFSGIRNTEVSDIEIRREGKSYTIDTLGEIKKEYPDAELYLLMGTDMFVTLDQWKDHEIIMKTVCPVVFRRNQGDDELIREARKRYSEDFRVETTAVDNNVVEISSTQLREGLASRVGVTYISEEVYGYIIRNKLYGAKPNFDWMRHKAYTMLREKRIPHVAGCEYEAVKLADRWGADPDKAREAAILHDITKKEELTEQLILCRKYGIITDNAEESNVKLLHAKTGAALAKDLFASDDDIYEAIFWHTTGKKDMSLLEKIIYIADYIEPSRDFEGLDILRRLAYENIDQSLLTGLQMSIDDLKSRGIDPHVRTEEAIDYLRRGYSHKKG